MLGLITVFTELFGTTNMRTIKFEELTEEEKSDAKYVTYRDKTLAEFTVCPKLDKDIQDEIVKAREIFMLRTEQLKLELLAKVAARLNDEDISVETTWQKKMK